MTLLWPHQARAIESVYAAVDAGERRVCLCAPTGAGKTRIMQELAERWLARGKKVVLYTNRKLLTEQISGVFNRAGIDHGVRAAGWSDETPFPFQISSIQTEDARVNKRQVWRLHDADLALVDEAHIQKGTVATNILHAHDEAGAAIVGFTATPIGIGDLYSHLIFAGVPSELRKCGAIVPAVTYTPDEPDMAAWRKKKLAMAEGKDLSEKKTARFMMTPGIWGRVFDNFNQLNPTRRPTLLFAPGVAESLWFAEQFTKHGVKAAHIDGQEVWCDGEFQQSDREARRRVFDLSRRGEVVVLCNRFVLREGIDAPWLSHGIFATIFGSLGTYLQAGGRLLRAHPGLDSVTIQDHGGNWWRHGSLNDDREWSLDWDAAEYQGRREEAIRRGSQPRPYRCPKCGRTWKRGPDCPERWGGCGYSLPAGKRMSRPVVSCEGTLREMTGDVYRPRRPYTAPNGPALWEKMYWRSKTKKGARTFRAAMALFAIENNWGWPDRSWPFMPKSDDDLFWLVGDVPPDRLIPKEREHGHEDREETSEIRQGAEA